jgi:hypothetical protein
MDRYEDIYGEKLHFKERKFTTDTKHSGCQYTISSRPKSMSNLPPILVAPVLLVTLWFLIQIVITKCHLDVVILMWFFPDQLPLHYFMYNINGGIICDDVIDDVARSK